MAKKPADIAETDRAAPDVLAELVLVAGEGRTVLQEDGRPWPAEGLTDPDTLYSRRRKADGDLVAALRVPNDEGGES